MNTIIKSIFFILAVCLLASCSKTTIIKADYGVIPLPQNTVLADSGQFVLNHNTRIVYAKGNDVQKQTADFLSDYIKLSTGLTLAVTDEDVTENAIVLKSDYQAGGKAESYKLTVNDKQIEINGSDDAGTFYGVQTLRKSIPVDAIKNTVAFPAVSITDNPRFQYRGMMLDVGRHFFPTEFVKKYIDILALHNINRFHWHLTDDQGWRIEIKKYPKLTEVGSQRAQTVIGHNSGKFDGTPYGGFYTQDEIKDVVDYAQKRFITVIPEIDLPGHMLAALTAYPELGCTGGPYKVGEEWGVFDDVLCAGNDSVYTFLDGVFAELIELFPSKYIHVGGDECPKTKWKECPKCQAQIKKIGLKSDAHHTKEDRLQSYVISHVEKFLNSKGRQIIGWDEILEGGLAPNATVMSWRGMDGGIAAAQQHHDVIMAPNSHVYFDYYQTRDTQNEPMAIGGFVSVEKVYNLEPVPAVLKDDEKKYIIGTQANLWTEYIPTTEQVEYMLLPRLAALAEVQWIMPEKKDYKTFLPRLEKLMLQYKQAGYNYATHVTDISSDVKTDTAKGTITLNLFTYDSAPIYYTTDGTEPSEKNALYAEPITIDKGTQIRAIAVRDGKKSKEYTNTFAFNKATAHPITLTHEPHANYVGSGAATLVDGKQAVGAFSSGEWLGFSKDDMIATIDLKEETEVSDVQMRTYIETGSWIFGATGFKIELSDDGKTFRQVSDQTYPVLTEEPADPIILLTATFPAQKARYVKVTALRTPSIPAWHIGKGSPAFLFVDEIVVN